MKMVAASITFCRSGSDQMSAKTCPPQSSLSVLLSLSLGGKDICHFCSLFQEYWRGNLSLLQQIFLTQQSNRGLPHYG